MSLGKYILVNGTFVPSDEYRISLREVDTLLFSEKIRAVRTNFPFFAETLEIIKLKLHFFNQTLPDFTAQDGAILRRQLERTLTKNKFFLGAKLCVNFYLRDEKVQFSIESEKLESAEFELNEKGLFIDVFTKVKKPTSSLSGLSLGSETYWKIARNHLQGTMTDQLLLVNTEDQIVEAIESNVYLINGSHIRGVSCEDGAFIDASQTHLLDIFKKLHFTFTENEKFGIEDVHQADEIMLVNAVDGIKWILGFEGKRFFNQTIRKISDNFTG